MRVGGVAFCVLMLVSSGALAETGKTRRVGPWNVGAFSEKGQFQHCIMARPETSTSPGFGIAKGSTYLTLAMFSTKWKLEPGTTYPVTLAAGGVVEEFQAKVDSATAIAISIGGREAFVTALFLASSVEVRTAASTLRLPLNGSAAALRTLSDCFNAESQVAAANPFGPSPATPAPENPFKTPAPAAAPAAPAPAPAPAPPAVAAAPAPAAASRAEAAYLKSRADCEQDADPDLQIAGCTVVIEGTRDTREVKGIALANRGFGLIAKGDQTKALASLAQSIEFNPNYANSRWGRADLYFDRGEWDNAIRDFDAALKIDPKDEYSQKRRAEAQAKKSAEIAARAVKPAAPAMAAIATGINMSGKAMVSVPPPAPSASPAPAPGSAPPASPPSAPQVAAMPSMPVPGIAAAPPKADPMALRHDAVTAFETVGTAPQTCGYAPNFATITTLTRISGLSSDMLDEAPYVDWRQADARRMESEIKADKNAFCSRTWAAYGEGGKSVPGCSPAERPGPGPPIRRLKQAQRGFSAIVERR